MHHVAPLSISLALIALLMACVAGCAPTLPVRARLVFAMPGADSVIGVAPANVDMRFTGNLAAHGQAVTIIDASGQSVSGEPQVDPADGRHLTVPLRTTTATGPFTVHWQSISAASGDTSSGEYVFTVRSGAPLAPTLNIVQPMTDVQQTVDVSGQGFTPRTTIKLTIADDEEPMGTAETDQNGAFSTSLTVPADIPFGQQPLWARDAQGAAAVTSLEVQWGGWPPVRVSTIAQPGPDYGEVTFTVAGRNRSDYLMDDLRIVLQIPDGSSIITTTPDARFDATTITWDEGAVDRTTFTPRSATFRTVGPVVGHARIEFQHRRARGCIGDPCLPAFVSETTSESGIVTPRN